MLCPSRPKRARAVAGIASRRAHVGLGGPGLPRTARTHVMRSSAIWAWRLYWSTVRKSRRATGPSGRSSRARRPRDRHTTQLKMEVWGATRASPSSARAPAMPA